MGSKYWNLQNITKAAHSCRTKGEFNNRFAGAVARAKKMNIYAQITELMVDGYALAWAEGRSVAWTRPDYIQPSEKTCVKCDRVQDIDQFYVHNGRHRRDCVDCCKNRSRESQNKPYRQFKKDICEECGFVPKHPCQLDVDHVDGNHKNHAITNLRTLCANCHRLKTQYSRNWPTVERRKLLRAA